MPDRIYEDLYEQIPEAFKKFSFDNYYEGEQKFLKPALEALGYTSVHFVTGERDSFGPLSRVAIGYAVNGEKHHFVYG